MTHEPARKVTEVAVGVLIRADGAVLLADRPAGKAYAGYWEFPGGKIETGETVAVALERELREELGITIGASVPWVTFEYDYPHAYVRLHFERVYGWQGAPHAREGQRLGFFHPRGSIPSLLLPAAVPVLRWLLLPEVLSIEGCDSPIGPVLSSVELRRAPTRPQGKWVGAFADDRADIERAAALQCDFAVVGPVRCGPQRADHSVLGWSGVAALARATPLPILAFGGLSEGDLQVARSHGAHGIAQLVPLG